jgi:hypothetical protein
MVARAQAVDELQHHMARTESVNLDPHVSKALPLHPLERDLHRVTVTGA